MTDLIANPVLMIIDIIGWAAARYLLRRRLLREHVERGISLTRSLLAKALLLATLPLLLSLTGAIRLPIWAGAAAGAAIFLGAATVILVLGNVSKST